ncbi:D-alanine--D-alanine ligase [Methyloceanibacter superfactus]|jgi:D-alanine-D-alanine ligase|uniref:D-alanine--D-alanine ligase n=1 Tax=Methyloceanibacter superfactus TaxID=1774969 RepID=A0A1E3W3K7_9HYPH|nr:D-alanine--D-alanine ligase [Methyloceanibacter superfactus]ODR99716.1 D-alanine--D-alanine ligase [Methyloceanibacter superfactus]
MLKKRVLVLMHADLVPPDDIAGKPEQEVVEYKTEYDVVTGLREQGHEVEPLGLYDDLTPLRRAIQNFKPHIVFNLLEEFHGEPMLDQNVVSFLELVRVPYTGCNPRGLMLARDKALSKKILYYHRIRVPRFAVVPAGRKLKRKPARLTYPLIVKSQVEEASIGIAEASIVNSDEKLAERIEFMHAQVGTPLILEQYVDGRELYVGVMGNARLQTLPVWELEMRRLRADAPMIATRRAKWNRKFQERRGVEIGPARDLPPAVEQLLIKTSKRLYRLLQLSGYARVDFRLDTQGRPYFLEANPNPDIGYGEEFAEAAEAAGMNYGPLLDRIIAIGLRKRLRAP